MKLSEFVKTAPSDVLIDVLQKDDSRNFKKMRDYIDGNQPAKYRTHPKDPTIKVSQIVLNYIKKIINFHKQFLFGKEPDYINETPEFEKEFNLFKKSIIKAKLNEHLLKLAEYLLRYGKTAEIIYISEDLQVKHIALDPAQEDFSAYFNENQELEVFSRFYNLQELNENYEYVVTEYCEIYTNDYYKKLKRANDSWHVVDEKPLKIGMPVVYYDVGLPIWKDVEDLQNTFNEIFNELIDINEILAYPILKIIGEIIGIDGQETLEPTISNALTNKIEEKLKLAKLKIIQLTKDYEGANANVDYMQWSGNISPVEFALKNIKELIHNLTSTPDIAFENLKKLTNVSGFALQMMFLQAEMQKNELFAQFYNLKRTINIHKRLLAIALKNPKINNISVKVKLNSILPNNISDTIRDLATAVNSGVMSQQTAIANNPYVSNTQIEIEQIQSEQQFAESYEI